MATTKRFIAKNGLDSNGNTITNVADPVNATDVVTKQFITDTYVSGKLLTNFAVGTNATVAASDSILGALGKVQGQLNNKQASGSYLSSYTETDTLQSVTSRGNSATTVIKSTYVSGNAGAIVVDPGSSAVGNPTIQIIESYPDGYNAQLRLTNSAAGGRDWLLRAGNTASGGIGSGFQIYDNTALASRLHIDSSGKVGIGTASPTSTLSLNDTLLLGTNSNSASIYDNTSNTYKYMSVGSCSFNIWTGSGASTLSFVNTGGGNANLSVAGDINITGSYKVNGVAFTGGTSINGTGFVKASGTTISYDNSTYLTTTGSAASLTSFPTLNQNTTGTAANLSGGLLFNNMGQSHGTQTDFNSITDFGFRYVQGTTNGPGTGSSQFYGMTLGLGSDYAISSYACQVAIPRDAIDNYISLRGREATTWGSWRKISAGYADNADTLDGQHGSYYAVLANSMQYNDLVMNTNPFGGKRLYINSLNNAFFNAEKRWVVTGNRYNTSGDTLIGALSQGELSNLFDGNYEGNISIAANTYIIVNIDFATRMYGYPYGNLYISHYYTSFSASATFSVYSNYAPHGIGWHDYAVTDFYRDGSSLITQSRNPVYDVSLMKIKISAPSGAAAAITQLDFNLDRPMDSEMPAFNKQFVNTLHKDIIFKNASNITSTTLGASGYITLTASGCPLYLNTAANTTTYLSVGINSGANQTILGSDSSGVGFVGTYNNYPMTIRANNAEAIRILANGCVGIGTTAPTALLEVGTNAAFTGARIRSIGYGTSGSSTANLEIGDGNTVYWRFLRNSVNAFEMNMSSNLTISGGNLTNTGTLYIGSATGTGKLNVYAGSEDNGYAGLIRLGSSSPNSQWGWLTFPDSISGSGASNNYYMMGRGNSIASREISIHMPNASDYGSGSNAYFRLYSTGAVKLFEVESATGITWTKGSLTVAGSIAVSGSWAGIRLSGYPFAYCDGGTTYFYSPSNGYVFRNAADTATIFSLNNNGAISLTSSLSSTSGATFAGLLNVNFAGGSTGQLTLQNQFYAGGSVAPLSYAATSGSTGKALFNSYYTDGAVYGNSTPWDRWLDIVSIGSPDGTNGGSNIRFLTHGVAANTPAVERMRINGIGNVGIGTGSPSAKLHIVSAIPSGVQAVNSKAKVVIDSADNSFIQFRNTADNGTYQGILFSDNNTGGYVAFANAGTSPNADCLRLGGYGAIFLDVGAADSTTDIALKTNIAYIDSSGINLRSGYCITTVPTTSSGLRDTSNTSWFIPRDPSNNVHIYSSVGGHYYDTAGYHHFRSSAGSEWAYISSTQAQFNGNLAANVISGTAGLFSGSGIADPYLVLGSSSIPAWLCRDGNTRSAISTSGSYPIINLHSTGSGNTNHGSTIQFNGVGSTTQFVIGTDLSMTQLDIGYCIAPSGYNPHCGIASYPGSSSPSVIRIQASTGYIGIGGSWGNWGTVGNPAYPVDLGGNTNVRGTLFVTASSSSYGVFRVASSSAGEASMNFRDSAGSDTSSWTVGKGTNGIGSTFGFYWGGNRLTLDTSGNVSATDFSASSDQRLKTDINIIQNPLDKLKQINGVYYRWNEVSNIEDRETIQAGVIAQEVLKVFPEAVNNTGEYMSVSYNKLVPLLIEGMKEQQLKIEALERRLNDNS